MLLLKSLQISVFEEEKPKVVDGQQVLEDGRTVYVKEHSIKVVLSEFDAAGNRTGGKDASSQALPIKVIDEVFAQFPDVVVTSLEDRVELYKQELASLEAERVKVIETLETPDAPDADVTVLQKIQEEEGPKVGQKLLEVLEDEAKASNATTQPLTTPDPKE